MLKLYYIFLKKFVKFLFTGQQATPRQYPAFY